ncbi:MAG: hypothetical protein MI924_24700 [Chloroflexales bacterium]|nr:hypothetical protein [Chloroflexales bacterium]
MQTRRRAVELERERKAALMQTLFTKGTRGAPTKITAIGEVPVGWEVAPFHEPVVFSSSLIRVSLTAAALPDFYAQYLQSEVGRGLMRPIIRVLAVLGISGGDLKQLLIPRIPLDEQREIAEVLRAYDAVIAGLKREAALHEELFRALLEELMTGRVRVMTT